MWKKLSDNNPNPDDGIIRKLIISTVCSNQVVEYFDKVIATDASESQLQRAMAHPRVQYIHTPLTFTDDDIVSLFGDENSVDLVTVAQGVHWFDLPNLYSLVSRLLRKPGGVFAVWCYNHVEVSPTFDPLALKFHDTTLPFWDPNIKYVFDGYKALPFPFETVGFGSEGDPLPLEIPKELSFEGFLRMLRSWSAVTTAKDQGVDLLNEKTVKELESAWGGPKLVRSVVYKAFMLAGKVRL